MTLQELLQSNYGLPLIYLAIVLWIYVCCVIHTLVFKMPKEVFEFMTIAAWIPIINCLVAIFFAFLTVAFTIGSITQAIKDTLYSDKNVTQ